VFVRGNFMKRTIVGKIMAVILSVAFAVTSVDVAALADETESGGISNPIMVPVQTPLKAGQKVTYDCIYFGSYPQTELVKSGSDEEAALITMNTKFTTEYKVLSDSDFINVSSAAYDSNGDATVLLSGGRTVKVRRTTGKDATSTEGLYGCYEWPDQDSYHYFLYEPIKWRVLSVDGNNAFLLADKCLDDQKYYWADAEVTWENSDIRSWLNDKFYNAAFSDDEKTAIISSSIENKNNLSKDTAGGNNTTDNIFLLSESEVYSTDASASYGFAKSAETYDEARRTQPSAYAFAMGCYREIDSNHADNCMWWLRSPGNYADFAASVGGNGYVFGYGYGVKDVHNAVRPALKLNLSSITVSYAGTVCTNGTVDEAASMGASGISTPRIVDITSVPTMEAGQKVTYDCVYFGSYPQTELVKSGSAEETALVTMNENFTTEYKVLTSTDFALISGATYDENGEASVTLSTGGAVKVRRIKKGDATYSTTDTEYYQWPDSTSYHYFLYEPIKWRVLSVDGNNALLLADKCLDDQKYHSTYTSITWEGSDIRSWLNDKFYNAAFSGDEKTAIISSSIENKNNLSYDTAGGNNTTDNIFCFQNQRYTVQT